MGISLNYCLHFKIHNVISHSESTFSKLISLTKMPKSCQNFLLDNLLFGCCLSYALDFKSDLPKTRLHFEQFTTAKFMVLQLNSSLMA
jgi:hypothetical protein